MQKFKNNFQTKDIWKGIYFTVFTLTCKFTDKIFIDEYNEFTSQVFDLFDVDGNGVLSFEGILNIIHLISNLNFLT